MAKVKIFLDAGHGGKDSGATYNGRKESEDVLKMALAVGKRLEKKYKNVKVGYSRTSDIYEEPKKKAEDANSFGADYFFSFHRNCYNGEAKGWETEYKSHSSVKDRIMQDLNKKMKEIGFTIRGDKKRDDLAVLNRTSMPALLFEIGFIDNRDDNKIFDDKFDDIVKAITRTIGDHCGLKKITKEESKKKDGYFPVAKGVDNINDFLHKCGYDAGKNNLQKIAAKNWRGLKKRSMLDLAKSGELLEPDGLNKQDD